MVWILSGTFKLSGHFMPIWLFARMPEGDLTGKQAADMLQKGM